MFEIVKNDIDEFNPYGLLPNSPDGEFDSESTIIATSINKNNTVEEIAQIASEVDKNYYSGFVDIYSDNYYEELYNIVQNEKDERGEILYRCLQCNTHMIKSYKIN